MHIFVVFFSLLSLGLADPAPDAYASNYAYYSPHQPLPSAQFHAQDDIGQYNYGYQADTSAKEEFKTADGVIRGSYSYVDANGIVQTTNYIADALGFRVAATNLPIHIVDDAHAAVAVEAAVATTPVEVAPVVEAAPSIPAVVSTHGYPEYGSAYGVYGDGGIVRPNPSLDYAYLPYATGYNYHQLPTQYVNTYAESIQEAPIVQVAPVASPYVAPITAPTQVVYTTAEPTPAVVPVVQGPADVEQSQYHAQDEFGQYSFGYNDPNSVRQEVKTADGVVRGAYRYVDAYGKIQTVEYIADAGGFRVAATNLPIHDVGVVQDTPEVAAIKAEIAALQAAPVEVEGFVVSKTEPVAPEPVAAVYAGPEPVAVVNAVSVPETLIPIEGSGDINDILDVVSGDEDVATNAGPEKLPAPTVILQPAPTIIPDPSQALTPAPVVYQTPVVASIPSVPTPVIHVAPHPVAAPLGFQYHTQDDIGQYSFGYSDQNSVKQELRTADGVVRGSYSYVDSNGIIQTVNYLADALGFRVGATNLPVHHIDAAAHIAVAPAPIATPGTAPVATPIDSAVAVPATYYAPVLAPQVSYSYLPYASNYGYASQHYAYTVPYAAPAVSISPEPSTAPVPIVTGTPVDAINAQFHAQDDIGQYNYGFSSPTQTKEEIKTADGVTRGSYSYIDSNGLIQTVNYISDAMGFRVAATNLPVHHIDGEAPAAAVEEVPATAAGYSIMSPSVNYAYLPYATNYAYHPTVPYVDPQAVSAA